MAKRIPITILGIISIFISSCGPSKLFGPTYTPTPSVILTPTSTSTSTPTFTPTSTATLTLSPTYTPSPTLYAGSAGLVFNYYPLGYSSTFTLRGGSNIFFSNANGSGLKPITTNGLLGFTGVAGVSPDGNQILIKSCSDNWLEDDCHIYIANIDGSGVKRLDSNTLDVYDTEWLPNGKIAYIANNHIYLINPDGTDLSKDKWSPANGHFPVRITGYLQNRLLFEEAVGNLTNFTAGKLGFLWWMMTDGSGQVNDIMGLHPGEESKISSDGTKIVDCDRMGQNCYIEPIIVSNSDITIEETKQYEIPALPNDSNCDCTYIWSPKGTFLLIGGKIETGAGTKYTYYTWKIGDPSVTELTKLEFDNTNGNYGPLSIDISPDERQVLITDYADYIAILDLSTMKLSREFGCTISKTCPATPKLNQPFNLNAFAASRVIDSDFWLPSK